MLDERIKNINNFDSHVATSTFVEQNNVLHEIKIKSGNMLKGTAKQHKIQRKTKLIV